MQTLTSEGRDVDWN